MPFLTPDASENQAVVVSITIPPDLVPMVNGAMYELSLIERWEEFGDRTPEECANILGKAWRSALIKESVFYDALIAAWDLDEDAGVRHDWHRGHHFSDINTVGSRVGLNGQAASFIRANSEYLALPDSSDFDFATSSFTLVALVTLDDKTTVQRIFAKGTGSALEFFVSYNNGLDRFVFQTSSNGTSLSTLLQATNFGSPSAGQRYLVSAWRDAVKDEIGIQINDTTPNLAAFAGDIYNGSGGLRLSNEIQSLNGAIDVAYAFDSVFSKDKIDWIYNGGNLRSYEELIAYTG